MNLLGRKELLCVAFTKIFQSFICRAPLRDAEQLH